MFILSAIARALLSWLFIDAGIDVLRKPAGRAKLVAPALATLRSAVPQLPGDDVLLVRANAAVQLLGGLTLLRGRHSRTAAAALVASMIPTTVAGHPFWEITDAAQRGPQKAHFEKNAAIIGGLLLVVSARRSTRG